MSIKSKFDIFIVQKKESFCRLRNEFITLRIDLIRKLTLKGETLEPHNMTLERYFKLCQEKYQNTPDIICHNAILFLLYLIPKNSKNGNSKKRKL